jgi:hypothetical protein
VITIALALMAASASPPPPPIPPQLAELVEPCRTRALAAYRANKPEVIWAYVDGLLREKGHRQPEIVACAAYLLGVVDAPKYRW